MVEEIRLVLATLALVVILIAVVEILIKNWKKCCEAKGEGGYGRANRCKDCGKVFELYRPVGTWFFIPIFNCIECGSPNLEGISGNWDGEHFELSPWQYSKDLEAWRSGDDGGRAA